MELYHSSCYLSPPQPLSHSIITFGHPSPHPQTITHYNYCCITFWYIFMQFAASFVFFHKYCIYWVISSIVLPPCSPPPPSPTPCLTQLLFPEPLPLSVNDIFESALRLVILITFLNLQTNHYIKVFYVCLICLKKSLFMTQYFKNTLSIL